MEILKFDELKKVQLGNAIGTAGVSANVKTNQNLKRKLIAYVSCSSVKVMDSGCCKSSTPVKPKQS